VTPRNRSYFLNELDGFAGNTGILTLATSNHPERLDPAIIDRPSRFDRKYPFDLPAVQERRTYIGMWNETLRRELRLSEDGIARVAEDTDDFSFAYLKELFLSATMRWIGSSQPGSMDEVMPEQVNVLREQMGSAISFEPRDGEEEEGEIPHHIMRRMGMARSGLFDVASVRIPVFEGAELEDEEE
jgi:ATPase family associated with various cellular activities (AAA)